MLRLHPQIKYTISLLIIINNIRPIKFTGKKFGCITVPIIVMFNRLKLIRESKVLEEILVTVLQRKQGSFP